MRRAENLQEMKRQTQKSLAIVRQMHEFKMRS